MYIRGKKTLYGFQSIWGKINIQVLVFHRLFEALLITEHTMKKKMQKVSPELSHCKEKVFLDMDSIFLF